MYGLLGTMNKLYELFQAAPSLSGTPVRVAILAGLGLGAYAVYRRRHNMNRKIVWSDLEYKENVVYLHMFPRSITKQVPNLSPFGLKVEMWLRMHGIEYEVGSLWWD